MLYRLALDIGSTSIGWAVLNLESKNKETQNVIRYKIAGLYDSGVRIYDDGRDDSENTPLSVARRDARGIRRNLDRKKQRKNKLLNLLLQNKLLPKNDQELESFIILSPYELRNKATSEKVSLYELGRLIFQFSQKRGFKSNRKDAKTAENSGGKIKDAIKATKEKLEKEDFKSYGELLYSLIEAGESIKIRQESNHYDIYPQRAFFEDEFNKIWEEQHKHYPDILSKDLKENISDAIFYQRPLKPQERAKCALEKEEYRAYKASPIFQKFRILCEVSNLEFANNHPLSDDERKEISERLWRDYKNISSKGEITFKNIRSKIIAPLRGVKAKELDEKEYQFNLEAQRDSLQGNIVGKKLSDNKYFGDVWDKIELLDQVDIINKIMGNDIDDADLIDELCEKYDIDPENAEKIICASLPAGVARHSEKAMLKMIEYLEQGYNRHDAAEKCGYNIDYSEEVEILSKLPYYGEALPDRVMPPRNNNSKKELIDEEKYGKIANPTVHIVLNQLRKLINELIDLYGNPTQIVVETARDLNASTAELRTINSTNKKNKNHNDKIREEIIALGIKKPSKEDIMKYKIWEDMAEGDEKRRCPFSGDTISLEELFSTDGKFEIEHIIPYSISFDDSRNNKVISSREMNRKKGKKTPYEAFGHDEKHYREIMARVDNFAKTKNKKGKKINPRLWRFQSDALDKLKGKEGDFIARALNDTRYINKVALQYLKLICEPNNVWAIPGQLTSQVRKQLGLNLNKLLQEGDKKNIKSRDDHRHHLVDAFTVGCIDRWYLQKSSELNQEGRRDKITFPKPYENYRENLIDHLQKVVISHKMDIGDAPRAIKEGKTVGQLHEETAYGYLCDSETAGKAWYQIYKPISGITPKAIEKIIDDNIRGDLQEIANEVNSNEKQFQAKLLEYCTEIYPKKYHNKNSNDANHKAKLRRVRTKVDKTKNTMIAIKDKNGNPYKYYQGGNNYCVDIFCPLENGTGEYKNWKKGKWQAEVIKSFDAHQRDFIPNWRNSKLNVPRAKLVMRLHRNDMVAYDNPETGEVIYCRVKKLDVSRNRIYLTPHLVAHEEADKKSWAASANQLQEKNCRKIAISPSGKIKDCGGYHKLRNIA